MCLCGATERERESQLHQVEYNFLRILMHIKEC